MPGFVMHMAEANLILNEIGKKKSDEWKNLFLSGSLLPDTKKKQEKVTSHFWDRKTLENLAIAPRLDFFLEKYETYLENPLVLGYYAHLHLDERFVNRYWPEHLLSFSDEEGNVQIKKDKITRVKILKTGQWISREDFFSDSYYYGDYTRLNDYFIMKYQVDFLRCNLDIKDCPITEVRKEDLKEVMEQLKSITKTCKQGKEQEARVFSKEGLSKFLEETAKEFVQMIGMEVPLQTK